MDLAAPDLLVPAHGGQHAGSADSGKRSREPEAGQQLVLLTHDLGAADGAPGGDPGRRLHPGRHRPAVHRAKS